MTRDEILAMEPGRELDALVAEKVFGWKIGIDPAEDGGETWFEQVNGDWMETDYYPGNFTPSTDISAAWEVVEKLSYGNIDCVFDLQLRYKGYWAIFNFEGKQVESKQQKTAPLAICKAALLAVCVEDAIVPTEPAQA